MGELTVHSGRLFNTDAWQEGTIGGCAILPNNQIMLAHYKPYRDSPQIRIWRYDHVNDAVWNTFALDYITRSYPDPDNVYYSGDYQYKAIVRLKNDSYLIYPNQTYTDTPNPFFYIEFRKDDILVYIIPDLFERHDYPITSEINDQERKEYLSTKYGIGTSLLDGRCILPPRYLRHQDKTYSQRLLIADINTMSPVYSEFTPYQTRDRNANSLNSLPLKDGRVAVFGTTTLIYDPSFHPAQNIRESFKTTSLDLQGYGTVATTTPSGNIAYVSFFTKRIYYFYIHKNYWHDYSFQYTPYFASIQPIPSYDKRKERFILVPGGYRRNLATNTKLVIMDFDLVNNTWEYQETIEVGSHFSCAVLTLDKKIVMFSGDNSDINIYDFGNDVPYWWSEEFLLSPFLNCF